MTWRTRTRTQALPDCCTSPGLNTVTTLLSTVFVLGVLIFVHELGHFLVAKWAGIKVERFSLGFPPKMIGKTVGETEYCLSWVPLGGYVKMAGENPEESEITGDPREFMSKSVGTRFWVIAAGPLMNFVAAVLIFIGVLWLHGRDVPDPNSVIVGPVIEDGPADQVGIQSGDAILAVDHVPVDSFPQMASLIHARPGDSIWVAWERGEDLYSAKLQTMTDTVTTESGADSVIGLIGVGMGFRTEKVGLGEAIVGGVGQTFAICGEMIKFLGRLASGGVSIKMVSGPVGIARIAGQVAQEGWYVLLNFMAVLSLNLAILNILPVPVLDGGHLLFHAYEAVTGRPPSDRALQVLMAGGLAAIITLMLFAITNDIWLCP
ncbi:MAG: RIP metalloprotease RseP [candidate division Zixibacteria bacterium]|nr:RIP metalloprotease RseP [candidate division Zixibacteria bacterium]